MRLFRNNQTPVIPPVPDDPLGMHRYAMETLELAESNWANVGNPFRFMEWLRIHRLVQARNDALERAMDAREVAR